MGIQNIPAINLGVLSLLLCIPSCASEKPIEEKPPTRVEIIQKNYRALANCVNQEIEGGGIARKIQVSRDRDLKQVKMFERFRYIHKASTFEFLFIKINENETRVESYGFETLVGRDHYPNQIWPFVMKCARGEPS